MKFLALTTALLPLVSAAPFWRRDNGGSAPTNGTSGPVVVNATGVTDLGVLQFALFLEKLEISLYLEGVNNYNQDAYAAAGQPQWVRDRFTEIIYEEYMHISTLEAAIKSLGGTPNGYCSYSFPFSDVAGFLQLTQMVNDVGPGAYTGASTLISSKPILTVAAQILAVEGRHNAWIRADVNKGDAFPQAFQVPLTAGHAFTLGSPFVTQCPGNSTKLIVTAKPQIAVSPAMGPYYQGQTIKLQQGPTYGAAYGVGVANATPANKPLADNAKAFSGSNLYAAFLSGKPGTNATFLPLGSDGSVQIPSGVTGQSYVLVSTDGTQLTDNSTVAGPAIINVPVPATTFNYQSS